MPRADSNLIKMSSWMLLYLHFVFLPPFITFDSSVAFEKKYQHVEQKVIPVLMGNCSDSRSSSWKK